jgi:hypothetical protein
MTPETAVELVACIAAGVTIGILTSVLIIANHFKDGEP